ncbi:uncharacterized protein LOC6572572 [Drosophila mojavensis]|uniref:DUF4200 domain-containing protein n=1 Tax=Drosophila mojavensis TaxID=7230 RepID=B4K690_DROMO|nr:uncharacterized protein LOC6572572 [Drosophila mojavensis]EDW14140.2 uncharacterized protein Dmoj_GI24102 [Drosophila mojavensis]
MEKKSSSERSRHPSRRPKQSFRDEMAPKPVHPRALRFHGLFGEKLVRQHFIVDDRWTPDSLCRQFSGMADLLARFAIFKRHEIKANRLRAIQESKRLKSQCRDGGAKLRNIISADNTVAVRNLLIAYKDMQRLYQKMPIHLVADSINQRTFVLRKERDRLEYRLSQLKVDYRRKLKHRAVLENHIKYQNEFELAEDVKSREFIKRVENSQVRLKAIKAINIAYMKMVQVLSNDAIYYDPILRSLSDDMEDQATFINHIIYLGTPAIARYKELNLEYQQLEEKSRRNIHDYQSKLGLLKTSSRNTLEQFKSKRTVRKLDEVVIQHHYVRETHGMLLLKNVIKVIEKVIRDLKFGTLCAQASEIYPRMRSGIERNHKLLEVAELQEIGRYNLEDRKTYALVLKCLLANNLGSEEIERLEKIKQLRTELAAEEKIEQDTLRYMKDRGDVFIMFRWSLWHLYEVLTHVDCNSRIIRQKYPNSYLNLPLLKFELLNMHSQPPDLFPVDIEEIMSVLKRKMFKLTKAYKSEMESFIPLSVEKYHSDYMETCDAAKYSSEDQEQSAIPNDVLLNEKTLYDIPSRKQIKVLSAKVIDQAIKISNT